MAKIRPFQKNDTARVVDTMAAAFADDALYWYFVEGEAERKVFLEKFMTFRLRYGCKYGTVLVANEGEGVAVFLKPGHQMNPADLLFCGGLRAMLPCSKAQRDRVMGFNSFADELAAKVVKQPCWHLSPICVAPPSQGKGVGKALMTQGLSQLREPCNLETQSPENVAFYQSCGFREIFRTPVPGTEMDHWGMLWEP